MIKLYNSNVIVVRDNGRPVMQGDRVLTVVVGKTPSRRENQILVLPSELPF